MTCQDFVEFISSYLEGDGETSQQAVFRAHIELCPPCLAYLDTYKQTIALGQAVCREPGGPIPEDVPEELVQAVLAARRASE